MAIQFRPDAAYAAPKHDTFIKQTGPPARKGEGKAAELTTVRVQTGSVEVYDIRGRMQFYGNNEDTFLERYRQTRQAVAEQAAYIGQRLESKTDIAGPETDASSASAAIDGVPEYWNKENTARRIFAIAMMGYEEGMDREAFAEKAIAMVQQVYGEVRSMLGGELPDLVMDTGQAVLGALQQFKDGAALSEISFE